MANPKHGPIVLRAAGREDIMAISELLTANGTAQGGSLVGDWSEPQIRIRIERGDVIILAESEGSLTGVLVTEERTRYDKAPPVRAMLNAYPGSKRAFVYGPVCVAAHARGGGILRLLYEELCRVRPAAEAVLFIRESNRASSLAHLRLGMREVARFQLSDEQYLVLSGQT